jgi:hypothetical protein
MPRTKKQSVTQTSSKLMLFGISALALVPLATIIFPKPAQANVFCQCTKYVANKAGLTQNFVDAKDWNDGHSRYGGNSYLRSNGFQQVSPRVGSIVVMETSFPGGNATFGHVGIVDSLVSINGKTYLNLRGANQPGSTFVESGCNNATVMRFGTPIDGRSDISFWAKGASIPSAALMVNQATGRALDAGGGANANSAVYPNPTPSSSNNYQIWNFQSVGNGEYMIINRATGRALDSGGGGAAGFFPYPNPNPMSSNSYQRWKLQPSGNGYLVISVATGKALDAGGSNGNEVYMYPTPMPGNNYQIWRLQ